MRTCKQYLFLAGVLLTFGLTITACKDEAGRTEDNLVSNHDHSIASGWNDVFLDVERYAAGYRPGPAPRALALLGLAAYEACLNGMPAYNSVAPLYSGLSIPKADEDQQYHWPTVVNAIYGYMMPRFFDKVPVDHFNKIAAFESLNEGKFRDQVGEEVFDRSRTYGRSVAEAVYNWGLTDAIGDNHYLNPFEDYDWEANFQTDGDWKPTFPGPGKPMGGVWGGARTFAITEAEKLAKPPLGSANNWYSANPQSALYSQAIEVYAQNTPELSYEGEWIGEFWSDDLINLTFSPGPRWIAVGNQVLNMENSNLETALFMNVKVGMALNDAAVSCWYSKYYYNVERPQTYINRVIDPTWKPALFNPLTGEQGVTPSFPAYPSGHSTMGAAGAETLAGIFGYAYSMTDRCHESRNEFVGVPRTFGSFFEMAQENAWSRVPLGVHFRMDCEEGVRLGTVVGRKVNNLPWKK